MTNKVLLTGTEGFIARYIKKNLYDKSFAIDIKDKDSCFDIINENNVNLVIHNGAISSTTCNDISKIKDLNIDYTLNLMEFCFKNKVKLIYASSASVYGDGPFDEAACHSPKNLYAKSKSVVDLLAQEYISQGAMFTGLRYFNVYGPYEDRKGDMSSVIYKFYNQSKNNGSICLFEGSDSYLRDFVYVDDILKITKFFSESDIYGIYNCGTGKARSFYDIASIIAERYSSDIRYIQMPKQLKGKYQKYTKSDNKKINSVYNRERISLEEGIFNYLEFLENE